MTARSSVTTYASHAPKPKLKPASQKVRTMSTSNTAVRLDTCYGAVFMASATYEVASAIHHRAPDALIRSLEADVRAVAEGRALAELRAECCVGADPGTAEEEGWNDWVDTVAEISTRGPVSA